MEDLNIIIGDVHLGRNSNNLVTYHYTELFFTDQVLKTCIELNEKGIRFSLTFMGDTFHSESLISGFIASRISKIIKRVSEIDCCISIYFLVGNHDTWTKKSNDDNSSNIFISNPKVHIVYEYEVFETPSGKKSAIISHCADEEKFISLLEKDNSDFLYMHQEIDGFLYKGEHSLSSIKLDMFKKYIKVYNGHIHATTRVKNLVNTGSVEQNNFGEDKNITGYYVADHTKGTEMFIVNIISPTYKKFRYSDIKDKTKEELNQIFNKKYVTIFCESEEDHYNCQYMVNDVESAMSIKPVKSIYKEKYEEDKDSHELKSLSDDVQSTAIKLVESKKGQEFRGFVVTDSVIKNTVEHIKNFHEKIRK
jgi:hypothetical protein